MTSPRTTHFWAIMPADLPVELQRSASRCKRVVGDLLGRSTDLGYPISSQQHIVSRRCRRTAGCSLPWRPTRDVSHLGVGIVKCCSLPSCFLKAKLTALSKNAPL